MSPSIISSGFKRSGIYPFNPDAIDYGMPADTDVEVNHNNEEELEPYLSEQCDHEEQDLSEQQFTPEQEELLIGGMKKSTIFLIPSIFNG